MKTIFWTLFIPFAIIGGILGFAFQSVYLGFDFVRKLTNECVEKDE